MAEQKIFPQQIDTTGSTTGQVLFSNGTNAYWGSGGFTGSNGYTGSVGAGYTGSVGYFGSVGYSGSQGYWGSAGYTGSWGYFGSAGYTGSQGYWGSNGYWGSVGYTGSIGSGYTGSTGTTAILYTSTTAPSSPVAGTFWYKTDEATLYVYYNDGDSNQWVGVTAAGSTGYTGSSGGGGGGNGYTGSIGYSGSSGSASLTAVRQQFTGDGSTTTFAVAGGYTPNAISVFVNGVLLRNGTEVTVTNGSTVVFAIAPLSGALIDVIGTVPTTYSSITPVGYSTSFNASQSLTVATSAAFGYGTGDFTIEFWIYFNALTAQNILSNWSNSSTVSPYIYYQAGVGLTYYLSGANIINTPQLSTGIWYHFAFVKASSISKIYLNGTQSGSSYTDNNNYGTSNPLGIGDYFSSYPTLNGTLRLNGYLSNVRIVKGLAVYTNNFTVPSSPLAAVQSASGAFIQAITGTQTALLTCNAPTIIDGSTNAFTITNNGSAPVSTAIVPTFTNVTINNPSLSTYQAAYLVVAGGGGGGFPAGGGGGAGGLLTNSTLLSIGTTYTITVGAGGNGGLVSGGVIPTIGTNSVMSGAGLTTITAVGGGGGGSGGGSTGIGSSGGSGGGAGNNGSAASGSAGTSGQGFAGGNNSGSSPYPSGGGGGSGAAGSNGSGSASGAGGAGTVSSITGSSVTYAGGGGGAGTSQGSSAGAGGAGGGGAGGGAGTAGTTNTGGGGGGASNAAAYNGGAGGSGVVIIAVPYANYTGTTTGSPTVTTVTSFSGTYKILTFTASGSYTA